MEISKNENIFSDAEFGLKITAPAVWRREDKKIRG